MMSALQMTITAAAGTGSSPEAAKHKQLVDAAQQFEAMFLKEMLKPMSAKEDGSEKDDGDDKAGDTSTYQSLGVEAMAKAVSAAGGLGIAKRIVSSVEKEAASK
jgi:peptidoglycan hydrolase FlgJ